MFAMAGDHFGWLLQLSVACALGFGAGAVFVICGGLATGLKSLRNGAQQPGTPWMRAIATIFVFVAGLQAIGLVPTIVLSSQLLERYDRYDLSGFVPVVAMTVAMVVVFLGGNSLNLILSVRGRKQARK
jgi:hypothetical protein